MGSNYLSGRHAAAVEGLGTQTRIVSSVGVHKISVLSFLTAPTGLVLTINLNGSPMATSQVVNSQSQLLSLSTAFQCAINDVITVVMSSAVGNDSTPNMVKSIVEIEVI